MIRAHREAELERIALFGAGYGLLYGLTVGYFFFAHPDWMFVYLQDAEQVYKPVAYLFFLFLLAAAGASGAVATGWFVLRERGRVAYTIAAGGLFGLLAIWRVTWNQYKTLGTFAEYWTRGGRPIFEVPEFRTALNIVGAVLAAAYVAVIAWRIVLGRRLPKAEAKPAG